MPRRGSGPRLRFLDKRDCYYIVWSERGRSRERSTGTRDRGEAEIELARFLRARAVRSGPRDPAEVLVTEILTDYMERHAPQVRAPARIAYAVEPLAAYWAGRTLAEISPRTCEAYGRKRERSQSTVRRELGVLRAAVQFAFANGDITRPVPVALPAEAPARNRWLTRQEAAMLVAGALGFMPVVYDVATRLPSRWKRIARPSYHLARFILIGLYTGRRKEAVLSLRWPAIDLARGWIDFRRAGEAETKKRRGRCRIPDRLLPHLKRVRRHPHEVGAVITWRGRGLADVQTSFDAAARRVFLEDVSPHTLRHTAASWLMQAGHDPWKVAEFLSMSLTTLLKVYGHHHPEEQSEIARSHGRRPRNVRVTA
jgi:integrase